MSMCRCVIMNQADWDALPVALASILERQSREGPGGFAVVSKETGGPIADRLRDWLCGTLALAFMNVEEELKVLRNRAPRLAAGTVVAEAVATVLVEVDHLRREREVLLGEVAQDELVIDSLRGDGKMTLAGAIASAISRLEVPGPLVEREGVREALAEHDRRVGG